jgi:1,4-alpha-glucan branching enzyme
MLKKKAVKSRQVVKVTFDLPRSELPDEIDVDSVHLVGEFNEWDETAVPLKYNKKAKAYRATVELEPDQTYQFRYLINGEHWCNDWAADEYIPNEFGEDNCVVITPALAANANDESDA